MNFYSIILVGALSFSVTATQLQADLIEFVLTGAAGDGLLEGNINPPTGEIGTGGIGNDGIFFDTTSNELHIHVEWGSAFGFNDLSADVFLLHLHGPTPDPAPTSFGQTAPLLVTLSNSGSFVADRTGGGVNDFFFIENDNVSDLLEGRLYINVHLSDTDTGVIRGYLVRAVPEPSAAFVTVLLLPLGLRRSRRNYRHEPDSVI